jgi:protein-S-isoprenylcysteine O-methyltransferase Ste14
MFAMTIYIFLTIGCWAIFVLVWFFSSLDTKSSVTSKFVGKVTLLRVLVLLAALAIIHFTGGVAAAVRLTTFQQPKIQIVGVILCALGIAFAVWARMYLGRNWGMPMTLRAEPELVTSGPYRYVRHPIYTGMLFALLGSALVAGPLWLLIFFASGGYFVYSGYEEEKDMVRLFPDRYPAYKRHAKMIIPFVF